ncbi:MAG: citrate transporter [Chloroflexi bacterium B3_Chlor]|nr:MAG: citrate transporter [Chloroflexi bacterium B3_Chlor]
MGGHRVPRGHRVCLLHEVDSGGDVIVTAPQIVAIIVFVITFVLILSDRVDRTIVAMAGGAVMVAVGFLMGFYSQEQALRAIDFNTLGLLLGIMIMAVLLERTGFFQYVAILAGKLSRGNPWLLMVMLGTATTLLSTVLPNLTVIVLIAPVTILIAEILGISPVPLLIAEALLSDTGGVATLVGDPPNVMIASAAGFSFNDFLTHTAPLVLVAWLSALVILRFVFRPELAERSENIEALMSLDQTEALKDPSGARRILIVLGVVILLFFVQGQLGLTPGFVALAGAAAALLWVRPSVEETLQGIQWTILLFFAALFVAVGGLEAAGVLELLAGAVAGLAQANLLLASILLLLVAAVVSAVVDNIPFTIAMIPVIQQLGRLGISTSPLWWALALGAGFGGNGTIIGSASNVVVVALSEKTRTPITSRIWMRAGLPVMIVTCIVGSVLFAIFFGWMSTP